VIDPKFSAELQEALLDDVLELLADVDDSDTTRPQLILEGQLREVLTFQRPRPDLIAALKVLIAQEPTAGEMRKRIRRALEEVAAT
jgi:hypothetical protein